MLTNAQTDLLGSAMTAVGNRLVEISEYCNRHDLTFHSFLNTAINKELSCGITKINPYSTERYGNWMNAPTKAMLKVKLGQPEKTAKKIIKFIDTYLVHPRNRINTNLIGIASRMADQRAKYVLMCLQRYGFLKIETESPRKPIFITVLDRGKDVLQSKNALEIIQETFKKPQPTDAEREDFWRKRGY